MYNMGVKIPKYSLAQKIFDKSITTVATSEVGTAYPSEHLFWTFANGSRLVE
jgi:hypothetical protein